MAIEKDLLDQLLSGRDPKDVFAKDGLVDDLKKALSERTLNAELDEQEGQKKRSPSRLVISFLQSRTFRKLPRKITAIKSGYHDSQALPWRRPN